MGIFKKWMAWLKYRKAMKKAGKQLKECLDVYERNNKYIEEIKALIEEDQKAREEK